MPSVPRSGLASAKPLFVLSNSYACSCQPRLDVFCFSPLTFHLSFLLLIQVSLDGVDFISTISISCGFVQLHKSQYIFLVLFNLLTRPFPKKEYGNAYCTTIVQRILYNKFNYYAREIFEIVKIFLEKQKRDSPARIPELTIWLKLLKSNLCSLCLKCCLS